jgi:hypothetical protein
MFNNLIDNESTQSSGSDDQVHDPDFTADPDEILSVDADEDENIPTLDHIDEFNPDDSEAEISKDMQQHPAVSITKLPWNICLLKSSLITK